MVIYSQDKKEIIIFENIFMLYIDTWNSEEFATEPDSWCIRAEKAQNNLICVFLGKYKTEERAKEVLQEIINKYKDYTSLYQGNTEIAYLQKPKVYEMPKE